MANRTILVDNNTWNNTHISRVGQVLPYILFNAPLYSRYVTPTGHVVPGGQGVRDHAGTGRGICVGDIRGADWICI